MRVVANGAGDQAADFHSAKSSALNLVDCICGCYNEAGGIVVGCPAAPARQSDRGLGQRESAFGVIKQSRIFGEFYQLSR